jgi:hypothetical protein
MCQKDRAPGRACFCRVRCVKSEKLGVFVAWIHRGEDPDAEGGGLSKAVYYLMAVSSEASRTRPRGGTGGRDKDGSIGTASAKVLDYACFRINVKQKAVNKMAGARLLQRH